MMKVERDRGAISLDITVVVDKGGKIRRREITRKEEIMGGGGYT